MTLVIDGAIQGMLAALDPHSDYLEGSSLDRLNTMIDGGYAGLGLSVGMDQDTVKVISPLRGSPAAEAGVINRFFWPVMTVLVVFGVAQNVGRGETRSWPPCAKWLFAYLGLAGLSIAWSFKPPSSTWAAVPGLPRMSW